MSEKVELFTAMSEHWTEAECLETAKQALQEYMPWRDNPKEIVTTSYGKNVVKVTIEVLPQTLAELLEDTQHVG